MNVTLSVNPIRLASHVFPRHSVTGATACCAIFYEFFTKGACHYESDHSFVLISLLHIICLECDVSRDFVSLNHVVESFRVSVCFAVSFFIITAALASSL